MTEVSKSVGVAVGLVTVPALVVTKLVVKALQGPDLFDPELPPPCWAAVRLPDRHAIVKCGAKATLAISISNLGSETETYDVTTTDTDVAIDSPVVVLRPLERATVRLELAIPSGTAHGALRPIVVTVGGCKTYRFRWLLTAKRWHVHLHPHGHHGHQVHGHVDIHDQPDVQHHWYDHFYTECGCDHG